MDSKIILPLLFVTLAVMACNIQSAAPTQTVALTATSTDTNLPPTPTATFSAPATDTPLPAQPTDTPFPGTSVPAGLTLDMLKNGTYHAPVYDRTITLVNGSYSNGSSTGGTEHIINIDSPGIWTTVSNPFTVNGSVTVLPFENTLVYRIYLPDGTRINESPLIVTPSGGTAGTFSHDFNLSAAGIRDWVIIQFVDVSAADGSTIALGSVILKAH